MALTLQQRLDEARSAYHDLQIGKAVAEVTDQNGEKIRYNAANRANLSAYIESLASELAGSQAALGPMRFWGR